jgi:outer membrane protein
MRRAALALVIGIASLGWPLTGRADPPRAGEVQSLGRLGLAEVVRIASENPPAVLAAKARADAARAEIRVTEAALLPTVTVSSSPQVAYNDQPYLPTVRFEGVTTRVDATLSASWTMSDFGRTANAARAARHGAAAAEADARTARESAAIAAGAAYVSLATSEAYLASARDLLAARESQATVVQELVGRGVRPAVDAVRMRLDVDRARLEIVRAETKIRGDKSGLLVALGFEPATDLGVDSTFDPRALRVDDDPGRAAERAVAHGGAVQGARERSQQAEASVGAAEAARNPTLSLSLSTYLHRTDVAQGLGLGGVSEAAQGALSLSWNVFDPAVPGKIANAARLRDATSHDLEDALHTMRLNAANAALDVRAARASLALADDMVVTAQLNFDMARNRYGQGIGGLYEVLDAELGVESARRERLAESQRLGAAAVKLLVMTEGPSGASSRLPK